MTRIAVALLLVLCGAWPALAQPGQTVRIERGTPVLERPRGDSFVLGSVQAGDMVEILEQEGAWYLITLAAERPADWDRGWIRAEALNPADRPTVQTPGSPQARRQAQAPRPPGRLSVRGFGQFGGITFTAKDSFEAVLDGSFGMVYGGGAQVLLPNGGFIQAGFERFSQDGARVLISGEQLFLLDIPTTVTVTPIQVTFGYRPMPRGATAGYLGAGAGVYRYREETSELTEPEIVTRNHFSFHLLGGAEYRFMPWASLAGEVQWTGVPKAIGDEGVSFAFDEQDLGGATFRLKFIIGR